MSRRPRSIVSTAVVCSVVVVLGIAGVAVAVTRSDTPSSSGPSSDEVAVAAAHELAEQVDQAARTRQPPRSPVADMASTSPGEPAGAPARARVVTAPLVADIPHDEVLADGSRCQVSALLRTGASGPDVACVEGMLVGLELLDVADDSFDDATVEAVRAYQAQAGLTADGMVGPLTAQHLGIWVDPVDTAPDIAADPATCGPTGRSVVIDRDRQLSWFCEAGTVAHVFPITTALSQPDPGDYEVYAKDLNASSTFGGGYSTMTHFVAFTYGKYEGARVAFHSVPKWGDGSWVQPLESVGGADRHGDSAGCIRVLPDDAVAIWDWLDLGGDVRVIT